MRRSIAGRAAQGGGADLALPAIRAGNASRPGPRMLHIVIDARRIRDFGIGTYIRSLVHALGAGRSAQPVHPRQRSGRRAHAGRTAGELSARPCTRAAITPRWITSRFRCFCADCGRTWCTYRSTACRSDDPALRGDHSRSGQHFFRGGDVRRCACSCAGSDFAAAWRAPTG